MRAEVQKLIDGVKDTRAIRLINLKINDDEIEEISKKLPADIQVISLDENNLTDQGAIILAEALHRFHSLKEIGLQRNKIGRDGMLALFGLKRELPELAIYVHGNKITNVVEMEEIARVALNQTGCRK